MNQANVGSYSQSNNNAIFVLIFSILKLLLGFRYEFS